MAELRLYIVEFVQKYIFKSCTNKALKYDESSVLFIAAWTARRNATIQSRVFGTIQSRVFGTKKQTFQFRSSVPIAANSLDKSSDIVARKGVDFNTLQWRPFHKGVHARPSSPMCIARLFLFISCETWSINRSLIIQT